MRCLLHAILIQLAFWEICLCNSWPSQELCNLAGPITRNKVGLALAIYELVSRSVPTSSFFQSKVKFLRLATCVGMDDHVATSPFRVRLCWCRSLSSLISIRSLIGTTEWGLMAEHKYEKKSTETNFEPAQHPGFCLTTSAPSVVR